MTAVELALIALAFLALFGFSAAGVRSVLAPAPLWNLMWFAAFITSACFGQGFIFDSRAMYSLAAVAAAFNAGCLLASRPVATKEQERDLELRHGRIPALLILLCLVGSCVGLVAVSKDLGTPVFQVDSFGSLLALGQQNAQAIFRGEVSLGSLSKAGFAVMQVGFALAGAQWRLGRSKGLTVIVVGLLAVSFLWSSVTTQRSYLLVPVIWFVAGYIAAATWTGSRVVAPKVIARALAILGGLVFLVVWLRAVRTGGSSASLDASAFESSLPWLAGYLPAFSVWFARGGGITDGEVPGLLGGVTGLVGSREDAQSGGNEYIGNFAYSNAPTMMRDVFAVDGTIVALLIVITMGFIAQQLYCRALEGRLVPAAGYAGVVAMVLWAPNAWFYSYGGRVLALGALLGLAVIAGRRIQRRRSEEERAAARERRSALKRAGRSPSASSRAR